MDSVEFLQRTTSIYTLASAAAHLVDCRCLSASLPAAQLAGYERLAHLRNIFEEGRQRVKDGIPAGARRPVPFGTWALLSTARIQRLFPQYRFSKHLPAECWAQISVDVFGRWSALHLDHPRCAGSGLYRLELRDWEPPAPITFFLPPRAEFTEGHELVVCEEDNVAVVMRRNLGMWFDHERPPTLAMIERCTGVLREPLLPFSTVWAVARGTRTARFALPFCAPGELPGEPRVLVRRVSEELHLEELPYLEVLKEPSLFRDVATASECVADLTAQVAAEQDHQPLPIVLADVLDHPGIHLATRHQLLRQVSARTGVAPEALVPDGFNPWSGGPYALNATGGTVYIAREDRYWRKSQREREFTAVTNFRLRLIEDRVDARGRVTHHAILEIGEKQVAVSFSSAVLGSATRLLKLLTEEARKAEAEYPMISDPKAKRLLPELINDASASARNSAPLHTQGRRSHIHHRGHHPKADPTLTVSSTRSLHPTSLESRRSPACNFNPHPGPSTGVSSRKSTKRSSGKFQSAPRSFDRGVLKAVGDPPLDGMFQSAPRSFDRGVR